MRRETAGFMSAGRRVSGIRENRSEPERRGNFQEPGILQEKLQVKLPGILLGLRKEAVLRKQNVDDDQSQTGPIEEIIVRMIEDPTVYGGMVKLFQAGEIEYGRLRFTRT